MIFAFDLLYLDGYDVRRQPLRERRRLLVQIVAGREGDQVVGRARSGRRRVLSHCLRTWSRGNYRQTPGNELSQRCGDWWQKITCRRRDSFVIVGFEPSTVPRASGRLLLAAPKKHRLVCVGGCGTVRNDQETVMLRELLDTIKAPIALPRKGAVLVRAQLAADVEYRAWTEDEKLRHPSFKGLRERADDATVFTLDRDSGFSRKKL